LVVDDEVDTTTVFELGIEKADLVVDAYNDPMLALSEYKPSMYDLLLFDIKMPKRHEFELYKKIGDIDLEKKRGS
jgi:DNA-binding response OmpR family regulator